MDLKRWVMAAVGAFGVIVSSEFVIHNVWLGEFYRRHGSWWRPEAEMQSLMGLMFAGQAALAVLLSFIYAKGYEAHKGTVTQGFRFGFLIGLLLTVPNTLMYHVIYPYPVSLLLNWLVGGIAEVVLAGMIIGYLYKPTKQ